MNRLVDMLTVFKPEYLGLRTSQGFAGDFEGLANGLNVALLAGLCLIGEHWRSNVRVVHGRQDPGVDNNQLDPDFFGAEAIDAFAGEDTGVVLIGVGDLERLSTGAMPFPHVVDFFAIFTPFYDGCWETDNRTDEFDVLADTTDFLELFLLGLRRS